MTTLRMAAVQMQHKDGDTDRNLSVVERFVKEASKEKVNVISFPECCLTGYMFLADLSAEELSEVAIPVDSEPIREIERIAKANDIVMSVGFLERGTENDVFNSYVTIGPLPVGPMALQLTRKPHQFPIGATLVIVASLISDDMVEALLSLKRRGYELVVVHVGRRECPDLPEGILVHRLNDYLQRMELAGDFRPA